MPGPPENYASLMRARRGYMSVTGADGAADVFPACFTWAGETIWIVVDPRLGSEMLAATAAGENTWTTFMVDRWDEDWARTQWLVARGHVTVLNPGPEEERALIALESKYPQFLKHPIQEGTVIRLDVEEWTGWDALEPEA